MEIDLDVCRTIAVKQGLPLQFVIKEFYVFDVLGQIAESNLVFKGGTALNKIYLQGIQRFSEDLDFDLTKGELISETKKIKEKIEGFKHEKIRRIKNTAQFYCTYESPLGKDNVRVDIAEKPLITANKLLSRQVKSDYIHSSVSGVQTYSIEDLTARKIHALGTRTEGKDVYDVFNALPLCGDMERALKQMLKSENKKETTEEFIEKTIKKLEKTDSKKLRNLTNPFIPASKRPTDWEQLENELILRLEQINKTGKLDT